ILGYGIDPTETRLRSALAAGQAAMADHVEALLAAIRASGFELSAEEVARYNTRYATGTAGVLGVGGEGRPGGAAEAGGVLTLASREPRAYTAGEAIALIHGAGGLAALAHPVRLNRRQPLLPVEHFRPLRDLGLDGLEIWHVLQPREVRRHYLEVAEALDLV